MKAKERIAITSILAGTLLLIVLSQPVMATAGNPHGVENFSTVPNTINEMLCMGHKGVIRLFPVWPREKDAAFTNIRLVFKTEESEVMELRLYADK